MLLSKSVEVAGGVNKHGIPVISPHGMNYEPAGVLSSNKLQDMQDMQITTCSQGSFQNCSISLTNWPVKKLS